MSASHLLGLQGRANGPSSLHCECCTWCHGIMNQNKSIIDHPTCRCNLSKSSIHYKRLMPCPSTGSRMLCASPKIHIHFVPHQKMISVQYLFFCAGTKVFEEALNAVKFLGWLKKFGSAKNILQPVKGQGTRLQQIFCTSWFIDHFFNWLKQLSDLWDL